MCYELDYRATLSSMGRSLFEKMSMWINITRYINFVSGPGDGSVTLATKLEMFFDAYCHVVSMCPILLCLTE